MTGLQMQLIKVPLAADQNLPSIADLELLEAFKSKRLSNAHPYEIGSKLNDSLYKAYFHLGYKFPCSSDFLALQKYLVDFLAKEKLYQAVCIDEIEISIKRGADRQYGEFFGINPATITGWIKSYLSSDSRKNAKLLQLHQEAQKTLPKAAPAPKEQWDNFVARLAVLYSNYLSGINIQPAEAAFTFKILRRSRVINFDAVRRSRLKQEALGQLKKEAGPKNATSMEEKRKMNAAFDQLLIHAADSPQVISRAMALGLIEWFGDLRAFGTTIEQAVNEEF